VVGIYRHHCAIVLSTKINKAAHKALLPKWKGFINGFLRRSPELLHSPSDQDAYGFASPRTWDFAAAILASCDLLGISPLQEAGQETHTCLELLKGCLGYWQVKSK